MATRYKTGNGATLALTGTLTTGVTTAWVGTIVSIEPGEWALGERDVSLLSDEDFLRRDPHDLATPNDVSGVVRFDPTLGVPEFGSVDTATITFAQQSTATSGVTQASLAGKGFYSRFAFPSLENNETMNAEFTLAMTGESLAYSKEA